jgi:N-acyl-D-aspartate/D-glutamate deacylase
MRAFLAHPLSVLGSDGLARPLAGPDHPHPRSFGAFPRVAGRYVREVGLLDLSTAVRKMSGEPARRLGLRRRGEIREGHVADLVVFDPERIADRADFAEPRQPPAGVRRTVVSGTTVAMDGAVLEARPGGMIRCGT